MITKAYKLFYSSNGNGGNLASLIIQQSGILCACLGSLVIAPTAAATNQLLVEASFSQNLNVSTNDTVGPFYQIFGLASFTAAGTGSFAWNTSVNNLLIPVNSGDRIYMNASNPGTLTFYAGIFLYVCY